MQSKIYVPSYESYNCAVVNSNNVIRVYDSVPTHNSTVSYTDYYFNSHYVYTTGTATFSNYSNLPTCLSDDIVTTSFYYRTDLSDILLSFAIIVGFVWLLLSFLIKKILKGRKYL